MNDELNTGRIVNCMRRRARIHCVQQRGPRSTENIQATGGFRDAKAPRVVGKRGPGASSASVTLLIAETTTTGLRCLRALTMSAARAIAGASSTDVPPNFNTSGLI